MVAQRFENPPQRGLVNRRVDLNRDAGQDNVHQTGLALVDLGHSRITADGIAAVNASIGFVTAMRRDDIDTRETWPRWRNNTEGAGQQLSAPRKQQTGINVVLARNRAHRHTAREILCHNLALLLYRPDPPALSPRRHPDPRTPRSHTISRMTIYKDRLNNLSRVIACHPQQASQPHSVPQCAAAATLTAQGADGVVELVPRVGDFVAKGDPLCRLHGGANWIGEKRLRAQVAFGSERTIDQDPAFAFRVIVDVAIKALSAAINDPTTAVLALDQLHRLLRQVGRRHLHDDAIFDSKAALRLIFATPDWEDFVQLTFSEIRLYGAANFQIARRVRAMIDDLVRTLPESRQPALRDELDVLDRMLERLHPLPEDLALAREPDLQGLGGAQRRQ